MPSRDPRQRLADILDNILLAREFTATVAREAFVLDHKAFYATTRCLEIISEASRRLPPEIKARHPEILWPDVAAAGNVYRHDYPTVDPVTVWNTVHHELDALEAAVRAELDALGPSAE